MNTLLSRREILSASACGFGYLAFSALANATPSAPSTPRTADARTSHFPARAKRVIFMFMQGGPSHLETFDYKPDLQRAAAKVVKKKGKDALLAPQARFLRAGSSGLPISEHFPNLSRHADDLCLLNGMKTDSPAHPQASIILHTGNANFVRPSLGSWAIYGLGSENENIPGFITIDPRTNVGGAQNYGSAFLPATFQGTPVRSGNQKQIIPNLENSQLTGDDQRLHLDLIQSMNRRLLASRPENPEIEGLLQSYELAFRMQSEVPETVNLDDEPESIKSRYGIGARPTDRFGTQCLLARRFAEKGVRFIQLNMGGWDQHNQLQKRIADNSTAIDQPIAALIDDLKERGLFDDTLIVWGGEFGRSPEGQNGGQGRRHNNRGYSMWMAGGGVQGGMRYGATDPLGRESVTDAMHTHDLHATILHLLGLDHEELTYRYAGRDFRLTDVHGAVATKILA